jgi:hypothetical protein
MKLSLAGITLVYDIVIIIQHFTCCKDEEQLLSRKQQSEEHAFLTDRMCYDDEDLYPKPQIANYNIFEDYDPHSPFVETEEEGDTLED